MYLYRSLNKMFLSRSYLGKILAISFIGVHVPIIGAVTYILLSSGRGVAENIDIIIAMLIATLVGTAATLLIHHGLLAPVRKAAQSLDEYLNARTVPSLPTKYRDEAGVLMKNVQESITRLDAAMDALRVEKEVDARHFKGKLELLSSMSHELRTPLNHIVGFAEMMSNEVMGPLGGAKYKDYAFSIGQSGGDLLETVKALTEIGEIEKGAETKPDDINLLETVGQAIGLTHFRSEQRGVLLARGEIDPDLTVWADPRVFNQALTHTLQAAINTSTTGTLCRVDCSESDGQGVVTVYADHNSWVTDDVPPELRHADLGASFYSSVNEEDGIANASPTAVHLSLVSTLMRANDGVLELENRGGQRVMVLRVRLGKTGLADQAVAA